MMSTATALRRAALSRPLVREAFIELVATAFLLAGEYVDALRIADVEEKIATRVGLDFVLPHVWVTRAAAHIGHRERALEDQRLEHSGVEPPIGLGVPFERLVGDC